MTTILDTCPAKPFLDVFISHASEDRAEVAGPISTALLSLGYSVWMSNHEIQPGDSLPLKINEGLRSCRFGVVVLSPHYLRKYWTKRELTALTSREETESRDIIIPVLHALTREQLTAELPLWAPAVSETWTGDPARTASAIQSAIGAPIVAEAQPALAFDIARALASGELDLRPRHENLMSRADGVSSKVAELWALIQESNAGLPRQAPDNRKRARAMMLAQTLKVPTAAFEQDVALLEAAAEDYRATLRRLLSATAALPDAQKPSLARLNEIYSGVVAAAFAEFSSVVTERRSQTVNFPKRHPDLTMALDRIGNGLGRLSLTFEMLTDFCVSELPSTVAATLRS